MSDLEEMDSERLNELESILYASIHYSDATSENLQDVPHVDIDAQTMPPPPQQQKEQQQQPQHRFVSNKRVINNATNKLRYWSEPKADAAAAIVENAKSSAGKNTPVEATATEKVSLEQPRRMLPPATSGNTLPPKNKRNDTNSNNKKAAGPHQQKQPKQFVAVQKQQQQKRKQPQQQSNPKKQQLQQQSMDKPPKPQQTSKASSADEPERFDQRLLVAIPCNWPPAKREPAQRETAQRETGPFAKASRKLEQMQRLEQKKQKSKQALKNKKLRQQELKGKPIQLISLLESDKSSDNDDVILVPLPPVPIINVDVSDDDEEKDAKQQQQQSVEPYIEENAMDATDVKLRVEISSEIPETTLPSALNSPCNSVLSSDDFIVQKDTSRLLAERERATDEDLLVLTEIAIRKAAEPDNQADKEQAPDSLSEHEFVPPSRLEEIKQNYRVDEEQFRALDVYESESDLNESGIYCKAKTKATTTIIRKIDSESDSSDIEEIGESNVVKTKRLRKRRASSTNQSQSDPNNEIENQDDDETDSDDGDQPTGVPGIARGMAVERCKRKIRRISQRRCSEGGVSSVVRKQVVPTADASSESAEEGNVVPTAREIAERLLRQNKETEQVQEQCHEAISDEPLPSSDQPMSSGAVTSVEQMQLKPTDDPSSHKAKEDNVVPTAQEIAEQQNKETESLQEQSHDAISDEPMPSEGSDANTEDEAEMKDAMTERISAVFERIDSNTDRMKRKQNCFDSRSQQEVNTTNSQKDKEDEDEAVRAQEFEVHMNNLECETDDSVELVEQEPRQDEAQLVQVEHNVAELAEQLSGGDLVGWNSEMCHFYNDSWGGEKFNLQRTLKAMSGQRHEWKIINADRFPIVRKRSNLKCTNCFEIGHMRAKCPRPRKPVICYTCGMTGHAEPRCPNAICLGCGAKQAMYVQKCNKCSFHSRMICQLCKMRGHSTDMCPDKWRRYHSTTRSNVMLESYVQYRSKNCSYCAARGHLFEECRQRIGEYRSINYTRSIISHQKVYKDRSGPISYLNTSFFSIDTQFHFNWSSEFPKNSSYARFLKAVGLARALPNHKKITTVATIPKTYTNDYVPNAQARAALTPSSVSIKEVPTETPAKEAALENVTVEKVTAAAPEQIQQEEISSNFENKPVPAKTTPKVSSSAIVPASRSSITPHDLDSDSNYSFSEHFEVPSSTTTLNESETQKSGPMDDLPDIIPLSSVNDDVEQDNEHSTISQGISMCVNSKVSTSSSAVAAQEESLPDMPSEAKIVMAHDQTQYLFSPEGRQFLIDSAKQCNVNVRMDFKEYGYVLVIYGMKKDQEDLQVLLLRRSQDVKRKSIEFQCQKPPKRIDVLIRFMRDGINSLAGNLGNAKNHYFRIKELERMNTKNGFKSAERKRRLLNMILFGQAGLNNGSMHLDQLLLILKRLVDDHKSDENASAAIRNEIEEHWKVIFSPIEHANYESLLQSYERLDEKNRLSGLNIEPALLGLKNSRKVQPTQKRGRVASPPPPPPVWQNDINTARNRSPKQQLIFNGKGADQQQDERPPPPPSMQVQNRNNNNNNNGGNRLQKQRISQLQRAQVPLPPIWQHEEQQHISNKSRSQKQRPQPYPKSPAQQQQQVSLPCHNMQQRASANLQLHRNLPLQSECVNLLAGMEHSSCNNINTDASKPSLFWSRESLKYLDELLKITTNPETLERMNRVLKRSRSGQLSHNDYRAVIRLHSLMEPN